MKGSRALGADVNARYIDGRYALVRSVYEKNLDMATVLIEFGARADMPFEDGETPLLAAAIAGALGMVIVFINAGVNKFELVQEVVAHNETLLREVGGGSTASAGVSVVMWQLGHWSAVASNVGPKISFFVLRR